MKSSPILIDAHDFANIRCVSPLSKDDVCWQSWEASPDRDQALLVHEADTRMPERLYLGHTSCLIPIPMSMQTLILVPRRGTAASRLVYRDLDLSTQQTTSGTRWLTSEHFLGPSRRDFHVIYLAVILFRDRTRMLNIATRSLGPRTSRRTAYDTRSTCSISRRGPRRPKQQIEPLS